MPAPQSSIFLSKRYKNSSFFVGGRNCGCMMAALLWILWATMNMKNLAFNHNACTWVQEFHSPLSSVEYWSVCYLLLRHLCNHLCLCWRLCCLCEHWLKTSLKRNFFNRILAVDNCVDNDCMFVPMLIWIGYNAVCVLLASFLVAVVEVSFEMFVCLCACLCLCTWINDSNNDTGNLGGTYPVAQSQSAEEYR